MQVATPLDNAPSRYAELASRIWTQIIDILSVTLLGCVILALVQIFLLVLVENLPNNSSRKYRERVARFLLGSLSKNRSPFLISFFRSIPLSTAVIAAMSSAILTLHAMFIEFPTPETATKNVAFSLGVLLIMHHTTRHCKKWLSRETAASNDEAQNPDETRIPPGKANKGSDAAPLGNARAEKRVKKPSRTPGN